jgi:hypothetical protein
MTRWQVLLSELEKRGYSAYKVSTIIGRRWDSVMLWKKGREPKYSDGEKLLELCREAGIQEPVNGN